MNLAKKFRIKWNFELTVFELTVPDLYLLIIWIPIRVKN